MSPLAILALSLSMSADAFAASVARGASTRPGWKDAAKGAAVFGIVETIAPMVGWGLGQLAQNALEAWDHWIAFVLLSAVGAHMIRAGLNREDAVETAPPQGGQILLILTAIGTSIDSAAVGVGLAFMDVNILLVAGSIGLSTFVCTLLGLRLGGRASRHLGNWAELAAGAVLIVIGLLILAEHTGYLPNGVGF